MWNLLIRIAKEDDAEELLKIYSYYVKNSANFDEQKKESLKLCAEYLLYMDSKDSFKVQNIIANRRRGNLHNDFS